MKISILGAGESGIGAALLAKKLGHEVFVSDGKTIPKKFRMELIENQIDFEAQAHSFDKILISDFVVKSPGIPDDSFLVKICRHSQIPIISEIEYASRFTKGKIIGITGSNGKTTTTLLCHHILKTAGLSVAMGGNIGTSFARLIAEEQKEYYVLELSSFQLDDSPTLKPLIAILLNISPDHLDRYRNKMENYIASKMSIAKNQDDKDYLIINSADENVKKGLASLNPLSNLIESPLPLIVDGRIFIDDSNSVNLENCNLRGPHNHLNIFCALKAAQLLGVKMDIMQDAIDSFENAPHRMEVAGTKNGVEFINDSKATNVDATFYALRSIEKPIVWIAGGTDKGNDYAQLNILAKEKVKTLICMGLENEKLETHFKSFVKRILTCDSMEKAVKLSIQESSKGDCVLLSPACASFDLFKNYIDRGDQFKNEVKKL